MTPDVGKRARHRLVRGRFPMTRDWPAAQRTSRRPPKGRLGARGGHPLLLGLHRGSCTSPAWTLGLWAMGSARRKPETAMKSTALRNFFGEPTISQELCRLSECERSRPWIPHRRRWPVPEQKRRGPMSSVRNTDSKSSYGGYASSSKSGSGSKSSVGRADSNKIKNELVSGLSKHSGSKVGKGQTLDVSDTQSLYDSIYSKASGTDTFTRGTKDPRTSPSK